MLVVSLTTAACGDEADPAENGGNSSDEQSTDNSSDGQNTDNPDVCALDVLETFDTAVPAGWTVLSSGGGGSGSGSNSGSGTGTGTGGPMAVDPEKTWHHTTVDEDTHGIEHGMTGGFMYVGGLIGMNEALVTPIYNVGSCNSVNLSFTHYFDDFGAATGKNLDKGEVSIAVDGPPWLLLSTYDSNPGKTSEPVSLDLSNYVAGAEYFQLEFVWSDGGQGNYGWSVDNVKITGAE